MSMTLPLPAARQAAVLAAIAVLHVAAWVLVAAGMRLAPTLIPARETPVYAIPPPPTPIRQTPPNPVGPVDHAVERVERPIVEFPERDDPPPAQAGIPDIGAGGAGSGRVLESPAFRGPRLQMRDARLQALIDSCYPSAARRRGEVGRGVARIVVDATGRAGSWSVERGTGFVQLDEGMGCVARRLQFEPARRGGRAVEAAVLMPIVFRLH